MTSNQFPITMQNNQIQKTVHGLTSLERLSTTDRQIVEANHQIKIREYLGDTKSMKVLHVIATVEKLLDTTESPSYEAKKELLNFLVENYAHYSPEEMVCAVKLNLLGTYGETIKCFNKIDIQYLTSCFNKYNDFKQRAILAHKAAVEAEKDKQPIKKATPEESFLFVQKYFEENNSMPFAADWSACFDHLYYSKLLNVDELKTFMETEKPKYIAEVQQKIATSVGVFEKQKFELELSAGAINYNLRKRYVQKWFENSRKHIKD